jgi:16S rRNA processing protein RimM
MKDLLTLARITSVHGLRGKVKAASSGDFPEHLLDAPEVWLTRPGAKPEQKRLEEASFSGQSFLLKLEGLDSIETARPWIGATVALERSSLPELDGDWFYVASLQGMLVQDPDGRPLGKVKAVYPTGANDVYEIQPPEGDPYLIPAIRQVVRHIDPKAGRMTVVLMDGLGPEDQKTE